MWLTADVFRARGGELMAKRMLVPFLGSIPIDPGVADTCDAGVPFVKRFPGTATAGAFGRILGPILGLSGAGLGAAREAAPQP